ncbi:MAG: 2-oxoglutarate dehydrogenase complex dihydrolipoyllysine-residue succinyltransferase [Myxococcales bacterium]|nr:2-oxoglutarate dehydrogenase complex dihydrolipoyllysine-residue succinyltransferase [Myxococcales bacterium]
MSVEIQVPVVGESITEGILVSWARNDGDWVNVDDPLFELETDKITMTVTAQSAGRVRIIIPAETQVEIGQVVGEIDDAAKPDAEAAAPRPANEKESSRGASPKASAQTTPSSSKVDVARAESLKVAVESHDGTIDRDGPAVRRLLDENGLERSQIAASGRDGRLTKGDVLGFLAEREAAPAQSSDAKAPSPSARPAASSDAASPATRADAVSTPTKASVVALPHRAPESTSEAPRQTREKMTSLRRRIAERLVEAQATAAILSTFNEVDMSQVIALRARYKEAYQKKHGVSLGFMSFFVKAAVEALQLVPNINAQIDGEFVVRNHFYDIGVAVGTDRGLVVPVVRDADRLSFAEIEIEIKRLAEKARTRSLALDDLTGGCFTISNGGVYGSLLSTPILNPPQSGILGMHGIKDRPVAVDGQIVIRPMMYLALSYDHRLVDGTEAVGFLRRIVECVENPERMMLGI